MKPRVPSEWAHEKAMRSQGAPISKRCRGCRKKTRPHAPKVARYALFVESTVCTLALQLNPVFAVYLEKKAKKTRGFYIISI